MLDVDHFKLVNDVYGHPAGDRILHEVALRIRSAARGGDVVARVGGEEFAILAPGLAGNLLVSVAERLRAAVAGQVIEIGPDSAVKVTVSIGVVTMPLHTAKPDELAMLADRAMYGAKQAGRDRILIGSTELAAQRPAVIRLDFVTPMLDYLSRLEDEMEGYHSPNEHSSAIGAGRGSLPSTPGWTPKHNPVVRLPDACMTSARSSSRRSFC